jgi:quercetin dioxygenase-like cupin family protein
MTKLTVVADAGQEAVYAAGRPTPTILFEDGRIKVISAGLEPGQRIPAHPEALAVYNFTSGSGWMTIDDERFLVAAGALVVTPEGSSRGILAETRLSFVATRIAGAMP